MEIKEAAEELVNTLEQFGDWEDGCFYYNKISAPELQKALQNLEQALEIDAARKNLSRQ